MIMQEIDNEFVELVEGYLKSSKALRDAAALCDDDPIKQDMVSHLLEDFNNVITRSQSLQVLVDRDYANCRDYILSEIKEITELTNSITKRIRNKLEPLNWN